MPVPGSIGRPNKLIRLQSTAHRLLSNQVIRGDWRSKPKQDRNDYHPRILILQRNVRNGWKADINEGMLAS